MNIRSPKQHIQSNDPFYNDVAIVLSIAEQRICGVTFFLNIDDVQRHNCSVNVRKGSGSTAFKMDAMKILSFS